MISFACSHCRSPVSVDPELAGSKNACPTCGETIEVPRMDLTREYLPGTVSARAAHVERHRYDFLAPAEQLDELGRLGPYRVLQVLGSGGMGVVFLAEDPELRRKVALKAMLPTLAVSESSRKRFIREAQLAAAIEHDHIVPIYQVGVDRGIPFLAMQLLKGQSLADRLNAGGSMPLAEIVRIGREMALGLAAAHRQGLIHRDIKPANLWLEADTNRVKILDFGLARAGTGDDDQLTGPGAILGTPAYMSPEQAAGQPVDARGDLFSLGCVLYRLCTSTMPFRGSDMASMLSAVASQHPRPPCEINPTIPGPLSDLVMQLLAKDPAHRPVSAEQVAVSLSTLTVGTEAVSLTERRHAHADAPRTRRLWPVVAAIGLAMVATVAIAAYALRHQHREDSDKDRFAADDKSSKDLSDKDVPKRDAPPPRLKDKDRYSGPAGSDIEVAKWLLARKPAVLQVRIVGKSELPIIRPNGELPDKPFKLHAIRFDRRSEICHELNFATGLSRLSQLHLVGCPLKDAALADLRDLPELKDLWLIDGEITDAGLDSLTGLTSLETLSLAGNRITSKGLSAFKGFPKLRHLYLRGNLGMNDEGLDNLKECAALMNLDLGGTAITDKALVVLGGMTNVSQLLLGETRVSDSGLVHLQGNLKMLDLSGTDVTDAGLQDLARLKSLATLKLRDNRNVAGPGLLHLKSLSNLFDLDLYGTAVTSESLAALKELPSLRILNLSNTSIDDAAISHLSALTKLELLSISKTRLSRSRCAELKKALKKTQIFDD